MCIVSLFSTVVTKRMLISTMYYQLIQYLKVAQEERDRFESLHQVAIRSEILPVCAKELSEHQRENNERNQEAV